MKFGQLVLLGACPHAAPEFWVSCDLLGSGINTSPDLENVTLIGFLGATPQVVSIGFTKIWVLCGLLSRN